MAGHKHAAAMADYAKDAYSTETPWINWQYKGDSGEWQNFTDGNPGWSERVDYRRKPHTLTIAGVEIEAPLKEAISGQDVYATGGAGYISKLLFDGGGEQDIALANGRLFATPEAAKAAYDAITALLTGKDAA